MNNCKFYRIYRNFSVPACSLFCRPSLKIPAALCKGTYCAEQQKATGPQLFYLCQRQFGGIRVYFGMEMERLSF